MYFLFHVRSAHTHTDILLGEDDSAVLCAASGGAQQRMEGRDD